MTDVQEVGAASLKDGSQNVGHLARLGAHGKWRSNVQRDFLRMAKRDSQWLKCLNVYEFDLQRYRDNALGLRTFKCSLALPHDTFATMAELDEEAFKRVFIGDADLKHFWHRVQNEDWFQRHPFRDAVLDAPHKAVPCRLHGDDADVNKNYNFLALNYSSVVVLAEETAVHKVGIGLLPLKNLAPDSLEQWYEPVVHSMWAAAEGKFPDVDHEGKPWTDLKRRARAGDPFRHGYRLIWIETVGDWKWLKESHQLPQHYGKEEICHMCCACKSGPLRFTDMSDDPAYELPENQRTQPAFVDAHGGRLPALCRLPGWGVTDSLRGDWQHECSLGVGQSAVGSALTELVDEGAFGEARGNWQVRTAILLKVAFKSYKTFVENHKLKESQPAFTVARLGLAQGQEHPPLFKAKAANTMVVIAWLADFLSRRSTLTSHTRWRSSLFWALAQTWSIMRRNGLWLDEASRHEFKVAGRTLLRSYGLLSAEAAARGSRKWPSKPKNHAMRHSIRHAWKTGRNPASHYCYKDEDYVGIKKKIVKKCHPSSVCRQGLMREQLHWSKLFG